MATNLGALGEVLGDGEHVLRGLNPIHCENGLPTEGCFIIKAQDIGGPSFGILLAPPHQQQFAPLGTRQGISADIFATLLPHTDYGIASLNVGRALEQVRERGARFLQVDDEDWGEHRKAHAMLDGYQGFERRTLNDLKRFLAKLASEAVLKKPSPKAI